MLRACLVILVMVGMCFENAYANYPYGSICPGGGQSVDKFDNWFCGDKGCFYKDR